MFPDLGQDMLKLHMASISTEKTLAFLKQYEDKLESSITSSDYPEILTSYEALRNKFIDFMKQEQKRCGKTILLVFNRCTVKVTKAIMASNNLDYLFQLEQIMDGISPFPEYWEHCDLFPTSERLRNYEQCVVQVETELLRADFETYFLKSRLFRPELYRLNRPCRIIPSQLQVLLELRKPGAFFVFAQEYLKYGIDFFGEIFAAISSLVNYPSVCRSYESVFLKELSQPENVSIIYQLFDSSIKQVAMIQSEVNGIRFLKLLLVLKGILQKIGDQQVLEKAEEQMEHIYPQLIKEYEKTIKNREVIQQHKLNRERIAVDSYPTKLLVTEFKRKQVVQHSKKWKAMNIPLKQQLLLVLAQCPLEFILKEDYFIHGLEMKDILPILIDQGFTLSQFLEFIAYENTLELHDFLKLYQNEKKKIPELDLAQALKQLDDDSIMVYQKLPTTDRLYETELMKLSVLSLDQNNIALSSLASLIEYPEKLRIYLSVLQQRNHNKYAVYRNAFFEPKQFAERDKIYHYYYRAKYPD